MYNETLANIHYGSIFSGNWWYLFTGVHSVSIRMLWGEKSDILTILLIVDVQIERLVSLVILLNNSGSL